MLKEINKMGVIHDKEPDIKVFTEIYKDISEQAQEDIAIRIFLLIDNVKYLGGDSSSFGIRQAIELFMKTCSHLTKEKYLFDVERVMKKSLLKRPLRN
jgi:hypothetical protein